jgi:hypothetical protein
MVCGRLATVGAFSEFSRPAVPTGAMSVAIVLLSRCPAHIDALPAAPKPGGALRSGQDRPVGIDDENVPPVRARSGYAVKRAGVRLRPVRKRRLSRRERGTQHFRGGSPSRGRETPVRPPRWLASLSPPNPTCFSRGSASLEDSIGRIDGVVRSVEERDLSDNSGIG